MPLFFKKNELFLVFKIWFWILLICDFGQRVNDHFHNKKFFSDTIKEPGEQVPFQISS